MRRIAIGLLVTVSAVGLAAGASAADLSLAPVYKGPPPPVPLFSWTGFYIGGSFGAGWGTTEWSDPASQTGCAHSNPNNPNSGNSNKTCVTVIVPSGGGGGAAGGGAAAAAAAAGAVAALATDTSHTMNGFLGGLQVGYNYQINWAVLGVEAQGSFADLTGHGVCGVDLLFNCGTKVDGLATFAGRFGLVALGNALIYMKGGGAWVHNHFSANNSGGAFTICAGGVECPIAGGSISASRWGWMWGTGIEYAFLRNWSVKVEYNFLDFGSKSYTINDIPFTFDVTERIHLVQFGVNYRF